MLWLLLLLQRKRRNLDSVPRVLDNCYVSTVLEMQKRVHLLLPTAARFDVYVDNGTKTALLLKMNRHFYWVTPSFQRSVAVLPLRFCRCAVAVLPFRSCCCAQERNCWKHLSVYIGMKWPERWLAVCQWQNGKNRIRSYWLRNGGYGATAGDNGNGTTEFLT